MKKEFKKIFMVFIAVLLLTGCKGKVEEEEKTIEEVTYNCDYSGEFIVGAEYELGDYKYTYVNIENNGEIVEGWNIQYTKGDTLNSTKAPSCTLLGNKPIISTERMYAESLVATIDISELYTKNVISMSGMFDSCLVNEIIGLEDLDTSNVTDMSGMFYNTMTIELNVDDFDTSKVKNMSSMFEKTTVGKVNLLNWNTSNVVNMDYMFSGVVMDELNLTNFDLSKIETMTGFVAYADISKIYINNEDMWKEKYPEANY